MADDTEPVDEYEGIDALLGVPVVPAETEPDEDDDYRPDC